MKILLKATLGCLACFLMLTACAHDYVTGHSSYNWFKVKDDVSLGKYVLGAQITSFEHQKVPVDASQDEAMLQRLRTIVKNISQVSHLPNLPYEVHLAESPIVNAWCAPGGKVMVYSGLWDPKKGLVNQESDDEIAGVLAHEIAHATARHVTESITRNLTFQLAGSVVSSAIAMGGSQMGSNLFGQFFSAGYNIYAPSYSRSNEEEADRIGLFYMAKAGYDPRAMIEVWKRAAQKKGDMTSIYASHPSNGARANDLQKYLPQAIEIYEHPDLPYPDFNKKLKTAKVQAQPKKQKLSETMPTPESQKSAPSDIPVAGPKPKAKRAKPKEIKVNPQKEVPKSDVSPQIKSDL